MKTKNISMMMAVIMGAALMVQSSAFALEGSASNGALAKTLTEKYNATSVQYAMMEDGKIIESGNSGIYSKTENKSITADMMYGIGSTSKMFVTVAVMKLVDQGKINLDASVTKYVPEFTMADERYKKITVRMLLNHSSGLMGSTINDGFLFDDKDMAAYDTLLEDLKKQKLKADPGKFSVYCNDGFTLAQIVVEKVSGKDFTTFVNENITQPLGMEHTKTPMDNVDSTQMPKVYSSTNPMQELPLDTISVIGTGGMYASAEDLCRFGQIFTGEKNILSAASVKAMAQEEYKKGIWMEDGDNILSFGLGWDSVKTFPLAQYGITALVKGGDTLQYHNSLVVIPEYNLTATVSSSGGSSIYNQLMAIEMLTKRLEERGVIKERGATKSFGTPTMQPITENLKKYEGNYGSTIQVLTLTFEEEGKLNLASPYAPQQVLETYLHNGDGVFLSEDGSIKLTFEEKNNRTYLAMASYMYLPELGQTASATYVGEKMAPYDIPADAKEMWAARNGKTYFNVSEKYTSQIYNAMLPMAAVVTTEGEGSGYLVTNKITGPNSADSTVEVPASGRDGYYYEFYQKDGTEYMVAGDALYMSQDAVLPIFDGVDGLVTIQSEGNVRWFSIGSTLQGKTITVKIPANAGFMVYDNKGVSVNQSAVTGQNTAVLTAGGYIAFAGEVGAQFHLTIQ